MGRRRNKWHSQSAESQSAGQSCCSLVPPSASCRSQASEILNPITSFLKTFRRFIEFMNWIGTQYLAIRSFANYARGPSHTAEMHAGQIFTDDAQRKQLRARK